MKFDFVDKSTYIKILILLKSFQRTIPTNRKTSNQTFFENYRAPSQKRERACIFCPVSHSLLSVEKYEKKNWVLQNFSMS